VCGVDTILIARTDANSATLLTSDCDEYDQRFVTGERTAEGFFRVRDGVDAAIARALAYAPYADLLWFETSKPDLAEATKFAAAEKDGYAAVRHQEFVGVGYFDEITQIATGGQSSVTAMEGSTEQQQFHEPSPERQKKVARR